MELVAEPEREAVHKGATKFLCRKAYRQASGIPGMVDRAGMYSRIYAMSGYRQVPPSMQPDTWIRSVKRGLRSAF